MFGERYSLGFPNVGDLICPRKSSTMRPMRRGSQLIIFIVALAAQAGERVYQRGNLTEINIKDLSIPLVMPGPIGNSAGIPLSLPIQLGIAYQFTIESDGITYFAQCDSNRENPRNFAAEWIVRDPIDFRIDRDKLLLKRANKRELRLGLLLRFRNQQEGSKTQIREIPPFAARQIVPECR